MGYIFIALSPPPFRHREAALGGASRGLPARSTGQMLGQAGDLRPIGNDVCSCTVPLRSIMARSTQSSMAKAAYSL